MRLALSLLLVGATCAYGQSAVLAPDVQVARAFDAFRDNNGPGCAVGVSRDGLVLLERGYGMANLETDTPIAPTSIFHVASVSKQFTATAIMLLARDGKLSVDDDIRKYLPEIPDYGTPITIRHLMTHTSGLRDQWSLLALARGRFEENRITEADILDILPRQTALNFTPGSEYLYSNSGFTLLGTIVRRVSGKSLREFADERIFKPLGMTSTHFHDDYTMIVPGRTSAYARTGAIWRVSIPNFDTYGATSLFTTVGDLLKWEHNFDAPVVGDAAIFARMQQVTVLTTGDTSAYGFGLVSGKYRGARVVEHAGADAGYRAYVGRFPDQKLAISIACNASTANTTALAHAVADAFLGASLTPVTPTAVAQTGAPIVEARLRQLAGVFIQPTTLTVTELSLDSGRLVIGPRTGPALTPLSETRFAVAVAGAPTELTFTETGYESRSPGTKPVKFERRPVPPAASKASLAAFKGDYVSDELGGAVYTVIAGDSTLSFRTGTEDPMTARLMFADTFVGGGYTIQFARAGGKVSGYQITDGRMRRVKFVRR